MKKLLLSLGALATVVAPVAAVVACSSDDDATKTSAKTTGTDSGSTNTDSGSTNTDGGSTSKPGKFDLTSTLKVSELKAIQYSDFKDLNPKQISEFFKVKAYGISFAGSIAHWDPATFTLSATKSGAGDISFVITGVADPAIELDRAVATDAALAETLQNLKNHYKAIVTNSILTDDAKTTANKKIDDATTFAKLNEVVNDVVVKIAAADIDNSGAKTGVPKVLSSEAAIKKASEIVTKMLSDTKYEMADSDKTSLATYLASLANNYELSLGTEFHGILDKETDTTGTHGSDDFAVIIEGKVKDVSDDSDFKISEPTSTNPAGAGISYKNVSMGDIVATSISLPGLANNQDDKWGYTKVGVANGRFVIWLQNDGTSATLEVGQIVIKNGKTYQLDQPASLQKFTNDDLKAYAVKSFTVKKVA